MRARVVILSAVVLVSACGGAAPVGTAPARVITINMSDFFFSPALAEVRPGERITFVLKNFGIYEHEFMAGSEAVYGKGYAKDWLAAAGADGSAGHDMGHVGAGIRVAPNETTTLTLVVPVDAGEFEFGCFIAGHYESGMKGRLIVMANGDATIRPGPRESGATPAKTGGATPIGTPHQMPSMGDDEDVEAH